MQTRYILPIVATLALGTAAAHAADPPQRGYGHHWRMDKKDMAARFKDRCANRYAHAVGTMAYLETRLSLKDAQKPAFNHWKHVVLASAKKGADQCAAMKPPAKRPSIVDMAKFREARLEGRLSALKAQMPALETLTASLDQKQDRILERAIHRLMREGRHGHRGFRHHGFGHGRMDGPMRGPGPMQGPGPDGPGMPG